MFEFHEFSYNIFGYFSSVRLIITFVSVIQVTHYFHSSCFTLHEKHYMIRTCTFQTSFPSLLNLMSW